MTATFLTISFLENQETFVTFRKDQYQEISPHRLVLNNSSITYAIVQRETEAFSLYHCIAKVEYLGSSKFYINHDTTHPV